MAALTTSLISNSLTPIAMNSTRKVSILFIGTFGVSTTKFFLMQGYYTVGSVFETWVCSGSPSLTVPSGHSLVQVDVASTWVQ